MATDRFNGVVASKAIKVRCVLGAEANVAVLEDVQTIESIAVVAGDRVLLTAQTDPIENGVWDVVSGGPWTRAADWDGNRDIEKGSTVWAGSFGQDDKLWQVQTAGVLLPGSTATSITELFNPAAPSSASLADVTSIGNDTVGNSIIISGVDPLLTFKDSNNAGATASGNMIFTDNVDAELGSVRLLSSDVVIDSIDGSVVMTAANGYIHASGHLIAGDPGFEATGITVGGVNYESVFKVSDLGGTNAAQMILHRHSTTIGPVIAGARSNTNDGTHALVTDGQTLLLLVGLGHDDTDYEWAGSIQIDVDGTAADNDMPGRICFSTTPTGATAPSERMRISSEGGMYLTEINVPDTSIAGKGQFWVKDDAPNVPMFTDDLGTDFSLLGGGAGGQAVQWNVFVSGAGPSDPGAGNIRLSTANPVSVGAFYISKTDNDGDDVENIMDGQAVGSFFVLENAGDRSQYRVYSIKSIADNTTWWQVNVEYIKGAGDTSIPADDIVNLNFSSSAWVEGGVELISASDLLYWEAQNNRWEATGSVRVNPNSPPSGGRLQLGSTSSNNATNCIIQIDAGPFGAVLWYAEEGAGTGFFCQVTNNVTPDQVSWGHVISSVETDLLVITDDSQVQITTDAAFKIEERAAQATPVATYGEFWVRSDTNQTPMFTDEAGVDYALNVSEAAATSFIINADINTATPPTTETPVAELVFNDLADDDLLASLGFHSTPTLELLNAMQNANVEITGTKTGGTEIKFLEFAPNNVSHIRSGWNLAIWCDTNQQVLQATNNAQTGLYYNGLLTCQTSTTAAGGWVVDNDYNGAAGLERTLTESDIHRGLPIGHYSFGNGTGGGDPGNGAVAFDSGTPASITECTIDDISHPGHNMEWLYGQIGVGDVLIFGSEIDTAAYITFTVDSVTDSTGYWTLGLTYVDGGTIFTGSTNVRMTWVPLSQAGGGGDVTASGSPLNGELAVWTSGTDIEGDSFLTFNGVILFVGTTAQTAATGFLAQNDSGGLRLMVANATGQGTITQFSAGGSGEDTWMTFDRNAAVTLFYDGTAQMATTTDGIDLSDNIIDQAVLRDYGIASTSEVVSTNAFTITFSEGPAFEVDLEAATAAVTGTISGGPVSGDHGQITVKVEQDSATAQTLTWTGGTMKWPGGVAHPVTTTVGGFTLYTFETWDGGTIWHGAGADYS